MVFISLLVLLHYLPFLSCTHIDDALNNLRQHKSNIQSFMQFMDMTIQSMTEGLYIDLEVFTHFYNIFTKNYKPSITLLDKFMVEANESGYDDIDKFLFRKIQAIEAEGQQDRTVRSYHSIWLREAIETCNVALYISIKDYVYKDFEDDGKYYCKEAAQKCPPIYQSAYDINYCDDIDDSSLKRTFDAGNFDEADEVRPMTKRVRVE